MKNAAWIFLPLTVAAVIGAALLERANPPRTPYPTDFRCTFEFFPHKVEPYTYKRMHVGDLGIAVYFRIDPTCMRSLEMFDAVIVGVPRDGGGNIPGYEVTDIQSEGLFFDGKRLDSHEVTAATRSGDQDIRSAFVVNEGRRDPYLIRFLLRRQTVPLTADQMDREIERITSDVTMVVSEYPKKRRDVPK